MKILYVIPGVLSKTVLGQGELERRQSILQDHAGEDTTVDVIDLDEGPESIESAYEEYLAIPETVSAVLHAEKEGYDGVILGCFGDPGLDAMREMVRIPVMGPGEASIHAASMLGRRFSIVTVTDSVVPSLEKMARVYGMDKKLASVRTTQIPVLELAADFDRTMGVMMEESKKACEADGADVIILGCMSMAFMMVSDKMQERLGIPVINPAIVSLKFLEGLIHSRISHSKRAFPYPPKTKKCTPEV